MLISFITLRILILLPLMINVNCHVPKLLVISIDGISGDHFNKYKMANFTNIIENGALVEKLKPQFPTTSGVNMYTLATGLYPEVHGVVHDELHDPYLELNLSMFDEATYLYNDDVYPIWNLNELSNPDRFSGSMMWPGANTRINQRKLMYTQSYKYNRDYVGQIDEIIYWFTKDKHPVNLVMYYLVGLTPEERSKGVSLARIIENVHLADEAMGYLTWKIKEANLRDLNVIITSDVGRATVWPNCEVDVESLKTFPFYTRGYTPYVMLWGIKDGFFEKYLDLRQNMTNYEVYMKPHLPERFHMVNTYRIPILSLKSRKGCYFRQTNSTVDKELLYYGSDNEDESLYTFMIGFGPSFASNVVVKNASNLDIFPLMLSVLKLPHDEFNGSLTYVKYALTTTSEDMKDAIMLSVIIFFCVASLVVSYTREHLRARKEKEAQENLSV